MLRGDRRSYSFLCPLPGTTCAEFYEELAASIISAHPKWSHIDVPAMVDAIKIIDRGYAVPKTDEVLPREILNDTPRVIISEHKLLRSSAGNAWMRSVAETVYKTPYFFDLKINDEAQESSTRQVAVALSHPEELNAPGVVEGVIDDVIRRGHFPRQVQANLPHKLLTYSRDTGMTIGDVFRAGVKVDINVYSFTVRVGSGTAHRIYFPLVPSRFVMNKIGTVNVGDVKEICFDALVDASVTSENADLDEAIAKVAEDKVSWVYHWFTGPLDMDSDLVHKVLGVRTLKDVLTSGRVELHVS